MHSARARTGPVYPTGLTEREEGESVPRISFILAKNFFSQDSQFPLIEACGISDFWLAQSPISWISTAQIATAEPRQAYPVIDLFFRYLGEVEEFPDDALARFVQGLTELQEEPNDEPEHFPLKVTRSLGPAKTIRTPLEKARQFTFDIPDMDSEDE